MPPGHIARAPRAAFVATVTLYGADHIRLVNEGSSGPLYECTAAACARAQTDNPSRTNLDLMDFSVLPDGAATSSDPRSSRRLMQAQEKSAISDGLAASDVNRCRTYADARDSPDAT